MSTATRYELATLRGLIDAALDATEGELTPEIEAALAAWDRDFNHKVESVALYITEQRALADGIKAEAAKLTERARARLARAESLTRYLDAQMRAVGKTRVDGVLKTVVFQANPPKVETVVAFDDADLKRWHTEYPDFVRHTPESFALDKPMVLEAAKAKNLPDEIAKRVRVVQSTSIRIR